MRKQSIAIQQRIKQIPLQIWLWAIPFLFLVIFYFYPLCKIFQHTGKLWLSSGYELPSRDLILNPLSFTVWQAFLSTLLTLLVGLPGAYIFSRFHFKGKSILRMLSTLPFILPTVVVAASLNALFGPRGILNILLMDFFLLDDPPVQILNTLSAILIAHVFYNASVVIRIVSSAWSQLDIRLEHAGRVLGASPWVNFREITFPLLRPSILTASLLVFLFDFTSFGVILMLGGPYYATLEVEIYIQALHMLNLPLAGLLSAIQLICTLVITLLYLKFGAQIDAPLMPRLKGENMRTARKTAERIILTVCIIILVVLLVTPLAALVIRSFSQLDAARGERGFVPDRFTLAYYRELFINRRQSLFYVPPIEAARNSLYYAGMAALISSTLGFLIAYALESPWRGNRLLEAILMLPLGTSAVTMGLGFIMVFNHPPIDVRSFPLLIPIAHSLVALPIVIRVLQPALASIPTSLRQAAAVLGASPFRIWLEIDMPIITRAALVGAIFSFTISLGEFGATSFLARPEYPTMPVAIYRFLSQPGALNYGQGLAMATLLLIMCGTSILIIDRL